MFPDPQLAVRDLLRVLLTGRTEPYAQGAVVSTKAPPGTDEAPVLPYIQVTSDGQFRDSRLNGRASVRVIVWHRDEGLGVSLAALAEALLLAGSSDRIRGASPLTGPLPTGDPDTGAPMSYFTITARLRPAQL
ncbi:hypothetical protein [Arthrobacter phage SWEP2]|nr:hypothetical protein [Arthrobacter phage SWEP2]